MKGMKTLLFLVTVCLAVGLLRGMPFDAHHVLSRRIAEESIVLLKNDGTLPLKEGTHVAVFGPAFGKWMTCGGYSCIVDAPYSVDFRDGIANSGLVIDQKCRDVALFLVCRDNGRGGEPDLEAYRLKRQEIETLESIKRQGFRKIVVVLNTGVACSPEAFRADGRVSSLLLVGFPGMEGANALGRILVGDVNPSGRLSRTLAKDVNDYPAEKTWQESLSYVPYEDDIFVGYRYFETIPGAKERVSYPFGHGLSYTSFEVTGTAFLATNGEVRVTAEVVNTGCRSGRQSVLMYSSLSGGKAEHPARELRAFAKTKLLLPGERELLDLSFPIADLAYFDDEGESGFLGSWVIDSGEYTFWIGGSVREVKACGRIKMGQEVLSSPGFKLDPARLARRMRADGSVSLCPVVYGPKNGCPTKAEFPRRESAGRILFSDVLSGRHSVDDFIDQLKIEDIAKLLVGGTNLVQGADTCSIGLLEEYGVPGLQTADGPLGVRFKGNVKSTQFPATDMMIGSFDVELSREFGRAMAEEAKALGVEVLLAPGVNLSRHPTCAREIEFMGEDPCLAGLMAAAEIDGIQSVGVAATLKHLAVNNRINSCLNYMSIASERAVREIYLRQFEIAVRKAKPMCVMTAYNGLNGRFSGANWGLVEGILKGEWGHQGLVMTDWGAQSQLWQDIAGGTNVKMPDDGGGSKFFCWAAQAGMIDQDMIRNSLKRVLELVAKIKKGE